MLIDKLIQVSNHQSRIHKDIKELINNLISPYYFQLKFWEWKVINKNSSPFDYFSLFIINKDLDEVRNQLTDKLGELLEFKHDNTSNDFLIELIEFVKSTAVEKELKMAELYYSTEYLEVFKELSSTKKQIIPDEKIAIFVNGRIPSIIFECIPVLIQLLKNIAVTFNIPLSQNVTRNQPKIDQTDRLKMELSLYGFFELEMVKKINQIDKLIEVLVANKTPFQIAMLYHLNFTLHIKRNHSKNVIASRDRLIAQILAASPDTVKKNMLSLNIASTVNRKLYTAHLHLKTVENIYKELIS